MYIVWDRALVYSLTNCCIYYTCALSVAALIAWYQVTVVTENVYILLLIGYGTDDSLSSPFAFTFSHTFDIIFFWISGMYLTHKCTKGKLVGYHIAQ